MSHDRPGKPMDSGKRTAPPPQRRERSYRLKTMNDVRVEMARVYSDARRDQIEPERAKGFIYMLSQIVRVIEGGEFERRINELEKHMGAAL